MRHVLLGIGILVAANSLGIVPSLAGEWCLQGGLLSRGNMDDCSYHTLWQCKISGGSGAAPCVPNRLLPRPVYDELLASQRRGDEDRADPRRRRWPPR